MTARDGKPCKRCGTSEWYANKTCKECVRQGARNNPERTAENKRRWKRKNPEKIAGKSLGWYYANRDRATETSRKWQKANPDKVAESARRYGQRNPDKINAKKNQRRTRKTQAGGSYTAAEWKELCNHYGNKCLSCNRTGVKLTADHIRPVVRGGSSNIDNIQPLCLSCNSAKGSKHIDYRPDAGPLRWLQAKLFG